MEALLSALNLPAANLMVALGGPVLARVLPGLASPDAVQVATRSMQQAVQNWVASGEIEGPVAEWAVVEASRLISTSPPNAAILIGCALDPGRLAERQLATDTRSGQSPAESNALVLVVREYFTHFLRHADEDALRDVQMRVFATLLDRTSSLIDESGKARLARQEEVTAAYANSLTSALVRAAVLDPTAPLRRYVRSPSVEAAAAHRHGDWYQRIASRVHELREYLPRDSLEGGVWEALFTLATPAPYSVGLERLVLTPWDRIRHALEAEASRRGDTRTEATGRGPAASARSGQETAWSWLERESRDPRHGAVIAAVGRWGSGKSRLAAEAVRRRAELGAVVLVVRPTSGDLADAVMQAARHVLGTSVTSWHQLQELVTRMRAQLVIVLDDLDDFVRGDPRAAVHDLNELVDLSGLAPSTTWVVTVDSQRLWVLLEAFGPTWWRRHLIDIGDDRASPMSGWRQLDLVNDAERPGFRILERAFDEPGLVERLSAQGAFHTALHDPLPAWLVAEHAPITPVAEFRQIDVVRAFWDARLATVGFLGGRRALDEAISLVAREFATAGDGRVAAEDLLAATRRTGRLGAERSIIDMVGGLEAAGLLVFDGARRKYVVPVGLIDAWALPVAQTLVEDEVDPARRLKLLTRYQRRVSRHEPAMSKAVAHYLALLTDWSDKRASKQLWNQWMDSRDLDDDALWSAAILTEPRSENLVLAGYARRPTRARDGAGVYARLRFAQHTRSPHVGWSDRLDVLCREYPAVREHGLHDYLMYVHKLIVDDRARAASESGGWVPSEAVALLDRLVGCEPTGLARELASQTVRALDEGSPDRDELVRLVTRWLSKSWDDRQQFPAEIRNAPDANDRPVWRDVINVTVDFAFAHGVSGGWRHISTGGWCEPDRRTRMTSAVRIAVDSAVHRAVGARAGAHVGHLSRDLVTQHVDRLMNGTLTRESRVEQKRRAFFILRHTVPIPDKGVPELCIDLEPWVADLAHDSGVRLKLGERYAAELDSMLASIRERRRLRQE